MNRDNRASREFVVMVKPIGSLCNMRCAYCYYLEADNGSAPMQVMTDAVLEALIRNYLESVPGPVASFTWHGGEPTLAGLDFFERAVSLQKKFCPADLEIWNNLQTNGILLDERWADFLAREHFDVGVSIDGAPWLHDLHRKDAAGAPTWERSAAAIQRLQARGIQPDLLCTVSAETALHGRETYQALKEMGTGWMQFIPIVERDAAGLPTQETVSGEAYGEFLKDVFARWFFHDLHTQSVQLFSETAAALAGEPPRLCNLRKTCGDVLVVERDGAVYACDHFVDQAHRLGSVLESPLAKLAESAAQRAFGAAKETGLTQACRDCPYLPLCGGGCPKHRFGASLAGEPGQEVLCPGLRSFYDYAVPLLRLAMDLSRRGCPPQEIMARAAAQEREKFRTVGRNDLCPCGSEKKAKNCCLKRLP